MIIFIYCAVVDLERERFS